MCVLRPTPNRFFVHRLFVTVSAIWLSRWLLPALFGLEASEVIASSAVIRIWPEKAPGSEGWTHQERHLSTELEKGSGKKFEIYSNVVDPTLAVFPASHEEANGTAVIVCPGGGWYNLMWDYEGTDLARWLSARGITAFVLKYRLRPTPDGGLEADEKGKELRAALQSNVSVYHGMVSEFANMAVEDGREALKIVRASASEWGVKPDHVGMVGFSAGGDIVTNLVLTENSSERPNFAALIYGVYLNERAVFKNPPPLFIAVGSDDHRFVPSEVKAFSDWQASGGSVELHVFAGSTHGFGMRKLGRLSDQWLTIFESWLRAKRFTK